MDVAAMSFGIQNASLKQQINISVQKIAMDAIDQNFEALRKVMEASVSPHLGSNIDMKG